MLRQNGVGFHSHQQITSGLRYRTYPIDLGSRLKVQYVLEGRAWSKTIRDSMGTSDRKVMQEVEDVVLAALGDTPYLLAANNDYNGVLAHHLNCVRLPVIAHGLNTYAHHTNLVFIAALNRHPVHHRLLRSLGYSNEVIRRSTADEVLHQILMRTNLRVPRLRCHGQGHRARSQICRLSRHSSSRLQRVKNWQARVRPAASPDQQGKEEPPQAEKGVCRTAQGTNFHKSFKGGLFPFRVSGSTPRGQCSYPDLLWRPLLQVGKRIQQVRDEPTRPRGVPQARSKHAVRYQGRPSSRWPHRVRPKH